MCTIERSFESLADKQYSYYGGRDRTVVVILYTTNIRKRKKKNNNKLEYIKRKQVL